MKTTISIIIPTYNPNSNLLRSLNKFSDLHNAGIYSIEVLIINTISQKKVEDLVKKDKYSFKLKIININKSEFNHGETRNLGVNKSIGKYIIFLSQDAYPIGDNFINYFIEDLKRSEVVAVFGKEIAPTNIRKDYLYYEHLLWFKQYEPYYDEKNRVLFSKKARMASKNSNDIFFWYSLSNVFSCYKRSYIIKHPFETIFHGEDVLAGKFIIENGYEKIFDSRCEVEHFHEGLKNYIIRNIYDWYFRLFVLKSRLRIKIREKVNLQVKKDENLFNIFEIYFYYFLKIFILITIFLIRFKQIIIIKLINKKKVDF